MSVFVARCLFDDWHFDARRLELAFRQYVDEERPADSSAGLQSSQLASREAGLRIVTVLDSGEVSGKTVERSFRYHPRSTSWGRFCRRSDGSYRVIVHHASKTDVCGVEFTYDPLGHSTKDIKLMHKWSNEDGTTTFINYDSVYFPGNLDTELSLERFDAKTGRIRLLARASAKGTFSEARSTKARLRTTITVIQFSGRLTSIPANVSRSNCYAYNFPYLP